jgi:hypothetical protein
LGWQVGLFGVKLTSFACTDDVFRVAQGCWPAKSLSESLSDQGAWRSVVSADPGVYLEKELLALGKGDALHEDASLCGAALVELAVDHNKGFGCSGYLTSCVAFLGENFMVDVSQ